MNHNNHILVVSQYFYPESFRINDICEEWIKRGYRVTVVTGIPNYPQGKFYKGYGWSKKRREKWNEIEIIRIPLIARGHTAVGLALNYLSFVISGFFWSHFTKQKADFVFNFEVSPMTQALVGVWYAKRIKIPCYLYVQDLWPDNLEIVAGIHNRFILNCVDKMVQYIYRHCHKILATSPSFVEEIQKRAKDHTKVFYWPQYAEDFYKPQKRCEIPEIIDDGSFKIIFTGNIGRAQGLDILPKTANLLKEKALDGRIKFVIVGDGRYKDELMRQICQQGVQNMFIIVERQPAEYIPAFLACCDAAFVSFMDNELFAKTIPAKLQSYMACGMPIIASATGETKRIVQESGCGICCPIGDEYALADVIKNIITGREQLLTMSKNSLSYFAQHFEKEELLNQVDELLFLKGKTLYESIAN